MSCKNHDKDYLEAERTLYGAMDLDKVEAEAKQMQAEAEFAKRAKSERFAQIVNNVNLFEALEKLNDGR